MKNLKYILLLTLAFAIAVPQLAKAQTSLVSRYSKVTDTVTNTGVKNMTNKLRLSGNAKSVVVTTANTALTGTLSAIARLYGSSDGVKYQRVTSTWLHGTAVDSALISVAKPNYAWNVDGNPFKFYQVQVTGVGTVTFTTQGLLTVVPSP